MDCPRTPSTSHSRQRGDCDEHRLVHSFPHLHWKSGRFLRNHVTPDSRAPAVLYVQHWLVHSRYFPIHLTSLTLLSCREHTLASNLSSRYSPAISFLARTIRNPNQPHRRYLLCMGVLLVVLADCHTCHGRWIQLGISHLRWSAHYRHHFLPCQSTQNLPWTGCPCPKAAVKDGYSANNRTK